MEVPKNYNSNIGYIEKNRGKSEIFISTWENEIDSIDQFQDIIKKACDKSISNITDYFFSDELDSYKDYYLENTNLEISKNNIYIGNNGTSSSFLAMFEICKKKDVNILFLTPVYYTYITIANELGAKCYYLQVFKNGVINIDFDEIETYIEEKDISLLILTDPIFGSGICLTKNQIDNLIDICKLKNIYLFIDYIYGGIYWNLDDVYLKKYLINSINNYSKLVLVESFSKNLFLNGSKTCIIYSNPDLIQNIENRSTYTIGSLTASQVSTFKEIYSSANADILKSFVNNNVSKYVENYEFIFSFLSTSNFLTSKINSGHFCLIGIPICRKDNYKNMEKYIFENTSVLVIPHNRYLLIDSEYFWFRVNLSLPKATLMIALGRLRKLFDKKEQ